MNEARLGGLTLPQLERAVIDSGRWETYCGEAGKEPTLMASDYADPLFIDWVYVIDAEHHRVHVIGRAPVSESLQEFVFEAVESYDLDGAEPNWAACAKKHGRRVAPNYLADIRARFGPQDYERARRQMLGDDDE